MTKAPPSAPAGTLRLVEATIERDADPAAVSDGESLCVHLPGGARVEVRDARQARLAAALLQALVPARPC